VAARPSLALFREPRSAAAQQRQSPNAAGHAEEARPEAMQRLRATQLAPRRGAWNEQNQRRGCGACPCLCLCLCLCLRQCHCLSLRVRLSRRQLGRAQRTDSRQCTRRRARPARQARGRARAKELELAPRVLMTLSIKNCGVGPRRACRPCSRRTGQPGCIRHTYIAPSPLSPTEGEKDAPVLRWRGGLVTRAIISKPLSVWTTCFTASQQPGPLRCTNRRQTRHHSQALASRDNKYHRAAGMCTPTTTHNSAHRTCELPLDQDPDSLSGSKKVRPERR
jgi:hypothetical protein